MIVCVFYLPDKGSTDSSTVMGEGGERDEEEEEEEEEEDERDEGDISDVTASLRSQQWSVDSVEDAPPPNKTPPQEFLSPLQRSAMAKVDGIMRELENIESFYANSRKVGDAHPQYRTLSFRRKVEALTLWQKVTKGLAQTLATLSNWLGVAVILPEMCRESEPCSRSNSNESKTVTFADQKDGDEDDLGGLKFSVGSPHDDPTQSLKRLMSKGASSSGGSSRGTLQRMFSSYQSMSLEGGMKGPYRGFVDRGLKKRSLCSLMESVQSFISPIEGLCVAALTPSESVEGVDDGSQVCVRVWCTCVGLCRVSYS